MTVTSDTRTTRPTGICPVCGTRALLINYRAPQGRRTWTEGYLGGHHRPGTREGTKCRGSFGGWVGRD